MTDYAKQVADLVEDAFHTLSGIDAAPDAGRAMAQLSAAQSLATLGLATEVRAVALLLAAGKDPAAAPSPELARDAFTAAALHLGLAHEDGEGHDGDPDGDGLYADGADPADKDVEL